MENTRTTPFLSLSFLLFLILLNGMGATIPIPNLSAMAVHFNFPLIGLVEAMFVIVNTMFLFIWGYGADKLERKQLIWIANAIWVFPALIIFLIPDNLLIYILGRLGMALGLAAFSPLAYSILADFASYNNRGTVASGLNIIWVGSSGLGILIGAVFSSRWNFSFGFLGLFGLLILGWQTLIQIPERGKQEPSFSNLEEYNYHWRIDLRQLPTALRSTTIFWLLIQGVFALIPGTFFTYYLVSFLNSGINIEIGMASLIAVIIASGRALGYPFFGKLGDFLARKQTSRARGKIAALCMGSQAFFFIFSFVIVTPDLLNFIIFSLLFWIGSFIGAASGPNRTALLYDVSLPEHRGTLGALFSVMDQIGVVVGVILSTISITLLGYSEAFTLSVGFYIVAAVFWAFSIHSIDNEKLRVQKTIEIRAESVSNVSGIDSR
ncbi:MAG: MFS transporter [Candidatus Hodarchaeales archaeon]|jgi:MFS family permease